MLPNQIAPPPEVNPEVLHQFENWRAHPYTALVLKHLESEISLHTKNAINLASEVSELDLKLALQRIKTQTNILKCLNQPLPPRP